AGTDYLAAAGTLTFNPGETVKQIQVQTVPPPPPPPNVASIEEDSARAAQPAPGDLAAFESTDQQQLLLAPEAGPQGAKTFTVTLSNPTNAALGTATATGSILVTKHVAIAGLHANQGIDAVDINGDGVVDIVTERPMVIRVETVVVGLADSDTVDVQVSFQ